MIYFSYQLCYNSDGSQSGPELFLSEEQWTGVVFNGNYYGAAEIPSLDALAEFQPVQITEEEGAQVGLPTQASNYQGFIHWMSTVFDVPTMLLLNSSYVSFPWFCLYGNAAGVRYCIADAFATAKITQAQYDLFKAAFVIYHLPITLP